MSLGERFRGNLGTKDPMRWSGDSDIQAQRKPGGVREGEGGDGEAEFGGEGH